MDAAYVYLSLILKVEYRTLKGLVAVSIDIIVELPIPEAISARVCEWGVFLIDLTDSLSVVIVQWVCNLLGVILSWVRIVNVHCVIGSRAHKVKQRMVTIKLIVIQCEEDVSIQLLLAVEDISFHLNLVLSLIEMKDLCTAVGFNFRLNSSELFWQLTPLVLQKLKSMQIMGPEIICYGAIVVKE